MILHIASNIILFDSRFFVYFAMPSLQCLYEHSLSLFLAGKSFIFPLAECALLLSAYGSFNHSAIFFVPPSVFARFVRIALWKQLCKLFGILFLLLLLLLLLRFMRRWCPNGVGGNIIDHPLKALNRNKTVKERQHYWHIANITNNKCVYLLVTLSLSFFRSLLCALTVYADFQCWWNGCWI